MDGQHNKTVIIRRKISREEEGKVFTLAFQMPENVERMTVAYVYDRKDNVIDFGLLGIHGEFLGWSGSDRSSVMISEKQSDDGFPKTKMQPGVWQIIIGAYKVCGAGVDVEYHLHYTFKHRRLFKGDTHIHSCASDGNMTVEELAAAAQKEGLDYLIFTDHNSYAQNDTLVQKTPVTLIPGIEWTHYKGHAGMLGCRRPFQSFISNSKEETKYILHEARENHAVVVLNHPFCPFCGWHWGFGDGIEWDVIEVWNGALPPEANEQCLKWWDSQLKQGKRIAVSGGSDFHRFQPGRMPASPCTWLYAMSDSAKDLLESLKAGHSFITQSPDGPVMDIGTQEAPGSQIPENTLLKWKFTGLLKGDMIYVIQKDKSEVFEAKSDTAAVECTAANGYVRIEIRRNFYGEGKALPVFISNPYYVCG